MAQSPTIISASRRTDIPAFYAKWFINRIREGYCLVPNPHNPQQIARISLKPEDVLVIVFWTRYPRPLMPYLAELDARGYRYYFQFTLMDNPPELDPHLPPLEKRLETFRALAEKIGADRVVWRYDPIVLSRITPPEFHLERHAYIAEQLHGYTKRNVISIVDTDYRKIQPRMQLLSKRDIKINDWEDKFGQFIRQIAEKARSEGMEIQSCAEVIDLDRYGVPKGKCVDDDLICRVFGINVSSKKDPGQREACGCVISRDIGMYDTCLFGCVYCYATSDFGKARERHRLHDPNSPVLIGRPQEAEQPGTELHNQQTEERDQRTEKTEQLSMF